MINYNYTFPNSIEESFTKGTFIDVLGDEAYFEVPSIFDENGILLENETLQKIDLFIEQLNELLIRSNQN